MQVKGSLGEKNCISHFLRMSGHGDILDGVHLLLLTATMRLTCNLHDLARRAEMSPTRRSACNNFFEELRNIITELSIVPEERVGISHVRSSLDVTKYGSLTMETAVLCDSAMDITVRQYVDPTTHYFLRRDDVNRREGMEKEGSINELIHARVGNSEMYILLSYPSCYSVMLPLLKERDLLLCIKDIFINHSALQVREDDIMILPSNGNSNNNNSYSLRFHSVKNNIDVNVTVNQTEAVESSQILQRLLKENAFLSPVIVFVKAILKQFHVPSSQLTSYVLTLMILSFSKLCYNAFPLFTFTHYPHRREAVEAGYILLSLLSFFSPLPRGQFDPREMSLDPLHPQGIFYEKKEKGNCFSYTEGERDDEGQCWYIKQPTRQGGNAAAACVMINECRHLFEHILVCILQGYVSNTFRFPALCCKAPDECHESLEASSSNTSSSLMPFSTAETEESLPKNYLISLLLKDWWLRC